MSRAKIDPVDRERWTEELCEVEDREEALREERKAMRDHFTKMGSELSKRRKQLMRYLSGREHEQPTLPGAFAWNCDRDGHVFALGACTRCGLVEPENPAAPKVSGAVAVLLALVLAQAAACGGPPCVEPGPYALRLGACDGSLTLGVDGGEVAGSFAMTCEPGRFRGWNGGELSGSVAGYCGGGGGNATLRLNFAPGKVTTAVVHTYQGGVLAGLAYSGPSDFTLFDSTAELDNFRATPAVRR